MKTRYKYIRFVNDGGRWFCYNTQGYGCLGEVAWSAEWKQWVFQPNKWSEFSASCLLDIVDLIKQLKVPEAQGSRRLSGKGRESINSY